MRASIYEIIKPFASQRGEISSENFVLEECLQTAASLDVTLAEVAGSTGKPRTILGLDPGSLLTGFGLLVARGQRAVTPRDFVVHDAGVLRAHAKLAHRERVALLHDAVYELLVRYQPDVCVLERAFLGANVMSALKLGELRGAYFCAAARAGVPVEELSPAEVKKTVAGNGRAEKEDVSRALRALLGFERGTMPHDVTDALAIGLSYALRSPTSGRARLTKGT